MADEKNTPKTDDQNAQEQAQQGPMLQVLSQYVKDQSFENPNVLECLQQAGKVAPQINISIEIGRQFIDDDRVEVVLMLRTEARFEDKVAFIAELAYGGLFAFRNVNIEEIQPLVLIECPRILFPYARQIMGTMTQNNGGYLSPILLDPPDFAAMYRDQMMRRAAEGGEASS